MSDSILHHANTKTRRSVLFGAAGASTTLVLQGCWARLIKGSPRNNPRSDEVMWGFVILDVIVGLWLIVGGLPVPIPLGLLIDLVTGSIFRPINEIGFDRLEEDDELPDEFGDIDPSNSSGRRALRRAVREGVVRIELCAWASSSVQGLTAANVGRWARDLRDHIESCPICAHELVKLGVVVDLPGHVDGEPVEVVEVLPLVLPAEVVESPQVIGTRLARAG